MDTNVTALEWERVTLGHFAGFLAWMTLAGGAGVAGNILVIALYPRHHHLSFLSGIFIHRLAIVDLLASLVVAPYNVIFELHLVRNSVACKLCEFVRHLVVSCSLLMLIGVAIERYYAICCPLKPFNQRHVQWILYLVFGFAVAVAFPSVFVYSVLVPIVDDRPFLREPHASCGPLHNLGASIYGGLILIAFCVLSLTLLAIYTIIYISIVRHLQKKCVVHPKKQNSKAGPSGVMTVSSRVCGKETSNSIVSHTQPNNLDRAMHASRSNSEQAAFRTQIRSASMLFGVTLVFILSWVPFFLTKLRVIPYDTVLHYLFFFNHASNIFIYIAFNRRFKEKILARTRLLLRMNRIAPAINAT